MRSSLQLLLTTTLAACSAETLPGGGEPTLTVKVAPLVLPGFDLVCYDLRVDNGASPAEPVIVRGDPDQRLDEGDNDTLCSTRFGNGAGGDISYVAPCDAQTGAHTVTLWLDGLYTGTQGSPTLLADYQDPCPAGCALQAACQENADTPVTFNITVMRRAQQGFFDIGVNFDNIFCSAKVDCLTDGGPPLTLLHHPETGQRGQTAVLALACTAGPGSEGTVLLRDPITITCGTNVFALDPAQPEGNVYTASTGANPAPSGSPIWQYAVYAGQEALECSGAACQKVYWNIALGFDPLAAGCTLTTAATAGTASSLPELTTPEASTWPIIAVDVDLTLAGGGRACLAHPLNGSPSGVATQYTAVGPGRAFTHGFDGQAYLNGATPRSSCYSIHVQEPGAPDGVYLLDPDGPGGLEPFEAYCDMTTDGGGWTLVSQGRPDTDAARNLCTSSAVASLDLDDTTVSRPAKLPDATINLIWSANDLNEVLMKSSTNWSATTATWERVCAIDFVSSHTWNTNMPSTSTLLDLEDLDVTCATGTFGTGTISGVYQAPATSREADFCGYSFMGSSAFFIYSAGTNYNYTNNCGSSFISGRSWLSSGNYGCNLSKVFVR